MMRIFYGTLAETWWEYREKFIWWEYFMGKKQTMEISAPIRIYIYIIIISWDMMGISWIGTAFWAPRGKIHRLSSSGFRWSISRSSRWHFGEHQSKKKIITIRSSGNTTYGDGSKPWYLVNPKIAGKWMFIPLKMVLIGIDPYPYTCEK